MGKMTLDRTKPLATVFGIADHRYEQDHKYFDENGDFICYEPGWETSDQNPVNVEIKVPKVVLPKLEEVVQEEKPDSLDDMSREEIVAELKENYPEVKFDGRARRSVLERTLIEAKYDSSRE